MYVLFYILAGISCVITVLPLLRKDHWTFRAFEFPRIQKLVFHLVVLAIGLKLPDYEPAQLISLGLVLAFALFALSQIFPFTLFAPKTLPSAGRQDKCFSLLISNVFQFNNDKTRLCKIIEDQNPDLILLVETDVKWLEGLKIVTEKYPYKIEQPQSDTYGMLFYSRFKFEQEELRFLVNVSYPSIKCLIHLNDRQSFWFYGMHPPPPSPTERIYSTARDKELLILANEIKDKNDQKTLVAGDLNDVAWSYTTKKFLKISGLKDPRKGRGVFPTFHARYFFMRWPLDHIFCSHHFRLGALKRLPKMGSDHFPVMLRLHLEAE